jgi:regulator of sigma D
MTAEVQFDPIHSKAMPDLISKLLAERQEMLVLFNRLAELKPYTSCPPVQSLLQRFCQVLMDYIALGHFEVYQCLEDNTRDTERCRRVKRLARELYPRIAGTTQAAVEFNDRYDCEEHCKVLNTLDEDLSRLGEQLAERIELEDRLITTMMAAINGAPSTAVPISRS